MFNSVLTLLQAHLWRNRQKWHAVLEEPLHLCIQTR